MHWTKHLLIASVAVVALAVTAVGALGAGSTTSSPAARAHDARKSDEVRLALTPSSAQLAACMPGAQLNVKLELKTEEHGSDKFEIKAHNLPPDREYTIFLIQQAGSPFGAAEYIGDVSTDAEGNGHTNLNLIVEEAFSSTIVNGVRTRVDLNRIGVWFADPTADDFCLGANAGPVTPFDGDNAAGVQAFNSANADPLPAP